MAGLLGDPVMGDDDSRIRCGVEVNNFPISYLACHVPFVTDIFS